MPCFQRNWFRADLCEMARSCSNLQQVDRLRKYAENSTIKVFYWGWLRVPVRNAYKKRPALRKGALPLLFWLTVSYPLCAPAISPYADCPRRKRRPR